LEEKPMERMMSARQVADLLGVHENWVYDQAVGGDLPSYKIGGARRFEPGEVQQWIAAHREVENVRRPKRASRAAAARASALGPRAENDETVKPSESTQRTRRSTTTLHGVQPSLFEN
jgi:excisionase family DNA binding protein